MRTVLVSRVWVGAASAVALAATIGCGTSGDDGGGPASGSMGHTAVSGVSGASGSSLAGSATGAAPSGLSGASTGASGSAVGPPSGVASGSMSGDLGSPSNGSSEDGGNAMDAGAVNGGSASGDAMGASDASDKGPDAAASAGSDGGADGSSPVGSPGVRVVGRTAGTTGALRFSWPGVNFNARFTGTQVSMELSDGSNKNRFTVVVDGSTPKTLTTAPGQTSLSLATGLPNGTHDLVVWRNTEASIGVTTFMGLSNFGTGGALLPPAAAPDRRIEVIGDSLSVGAGVEGASTSCNPGIDAYTNNYLAYGSVAARTVSADVVTIAWSGIGVYRSYSPSDPTMPARYEYAIANDKTPWDFTKYQPHVVVLNLGTNDFGAGNPGQPYVDAYVAFIKHVRSKYATAHFILIDMYGGDRLTAINSVVSNLKNGGESKVEALSFSSVPNIGTACNGHPNTAAQKAMGGILATRLKSLMGW